MTNKWVRSVSFNKKNVDDVSRLKLIGKKSFSKFVKRLLDEEIERRELQAVLEESELAVVEGHSGTPQQEQEVVAEEAEQKRSTERYKQYYSQPMVMTNKKPHQ